LAFERYPDQSTVWSWWSWARMSTGCGDFCHRTVFLATMWPWCRP